MTRRRLFSPKVYLNPASVWELVGQRNMSQNEPARLSRISPGSPSRLMNGRRCPSARMRRRLQEVLGVSDFD